MALLFHQVVPIFSGMISDRIGYSSMLVLGCFFSSLGYTGFYLFTTFTGLIISAFFVGIGAAFYEPSIKSIFGNLSTEYRRQAFTYFNQALNAGAVIGALIGGFLIVYKSSFPMILGGGIFFFVTIILLFFIKKLPDGNHSIKIIDSYKQVIKNKNFLKFSIIMILFWVMYAQLTVSLPLEAYRLAHSDQFISSIIISNGLYAFLLMFFLRKIFQKTNSSSVIKIGMIIMGGGLLGVALAPSLLWLIVCVLLFTTGETFVLPGADIAIAEYSSYKDTGAFYGVFGISYAIGGSVGNFLGTWLMDKYGDTLVPWFVYGLIGLIGFTLMHSREKNEIEVNQRTKIN